MNRVFKEWLATGLSVAAALGAAGAPTPVHAEGNSSKSLDLNDMSLDDLLKANVSVGTLTGSTFAKVPAAVTTITAEDISRTPARNLLDLLEIYVPGMTWFSHNEGPQVAERGIIGARNNRMILLVNGRYMNSKAHTGASAELPNWELDDIQRIEVIRGAGSVTYGPGALSMVVSITTKDAATSPGMMAAGRFTTSYQSGQTKLSYGKTSENYSVYGFFSFTRTRGSDADAMLASSSTANLGKFGTLGGDVPVGTTPTGQNLPAQRFLGDVEKRPQVKAHLGVDFAKDFKFWARYSGHQLGRYPSVTDYFTDGSIREGKSNNDRKATAAFEHEHDFGSVKLKSLASYSNEEVSRHSTASSGKLIWTDARNYNQNFSEQQILVKSTANFKLAEMNKTAVGFEVMRESFGAPWGRDQTYLLLGNNKEIVSGTDTAVKTVSAANCASGTYCVGKGWATTTLSGVVESNFDFNRYLNLTVSGRADKNTYTRTLFSPRLANVAQVGEQSFLKTIVQQSSRAALSDELYIMHAKGEKDQPETIGTFETIYSTGVTDRVQANLSGFLSVMDVQNWNGVDRVTNVGLLRTYGFEADARYSEKGLLLGASQSFVKQLNWTPLAGVTDQAVSFGSGIAKSFAASAISSGSAASLTGSGKNDLNSWPNLSTKLYGNYNFNDKLSFHSDLRIFWKYEGSTEMFDIMSNMANATGNATYISNMSSVIDKMKAAGTWGFNYSMNLSTRYAFTRDLDVAVYAYNLLGNLKRYQWQALPGSAYPTETTFHREPRSFAVQVRYAM